KVKMTAAVSNDIIELRNFSKLDFNGKHELLARGRPTPTLHELLRLSALAILSIESQRLCKLKDRIVAISGTTQRGVSVNDYFIVYIHGNFNHCDCSSLNREHEEAQQQETRYLIQVSPPPGYSASPPQRIATHT